MHNYFEHSDKCNRKYAHAHSPHIIIYLLNVLMIVDVALFGLKQAESY